MRWLRCPWPGTPGVSGLAPVPPRAAIAVVNFNTRELLSHLLFSVFRILDREELARVVVVDNASTDGSVPLLQTLQRAGLVDALLNRSQQYHGPGLNQAMDHLARLARAGLPPERRFDYVWVLDSDTVVLRPETLRDALAFQVREKVGLLGELQHDKSIPEGYAHVSSVLLDPAQVWQRRLRPFEESGAPAAGLQKSLRARGIKVEDFPFKAANYILHLGRGTLAQIKETGDKNNRYYRWATTHFASGFHGNPHGPAIHQQFLEVFRGEVPELSGDALLAACQRSARVTLPILGTLPSSREPGAGRSSASSGKP